MSEHQRLTEAILASYREHPETVHLEKVPLPSREAIVAILDDLLDLLFPGFFRMQDVACSGLNPKVDETVERAQHSLTRQILRALRHERLCGQESSDNGEEKARTFAITLLQDLPALRTLLAQDVQAAYEGDPAAHNVQEVIFCYPGLEAVAVYRIANRLFRMGIPLLPRIMTEWAHQKTGIDIHPGATIGPGFFIDHGTGVVIGETCLIGRNVKLYQGVTLGALSFPRDASGNIIRGQKRHPTLEDEVVVYANATILGGDTVVGHNAVVGSSVWLTQSVAPHTTVMMEKPSLRIKQP